MLSGRHPLALLLLGVLVATSAVGCGGVGDGENTSSSDSALRLGAIIPGPIRVGPIVTGPTLPPPPPPLPYVGDANDTATILSDSDVLWARYFGDADELAVEASLGAAFTDAATPPYWDYGQKTSALVQMYDLLAPLDKTRAQKYLARLHSYANAFLANRDDVRGFPTDPFRGRVMPAWGAYTHDRDDRWNTDVVTAGLFTYAMAAFARRVLENPSLLADDVALQGRYRSDAIRFTSAVLDTYEAFRPEMHLVEGDPHAYFTVPQRYEFLSCSNGAHLCAGYRDTAGAPLAYNENLSMMKALAEEALAANTALYRASPDASFLRLYRSTYEAPLLIAKNFTFFDQNLESKTLSDGTPYFVWNHQKPTSNVQDTAHGGFELGSLAVLLEDKYGLDVLLTGNGRSEQVALSTPLFVRFANTFLRKIWHYDFQNPDPHAPGQNLLGKRVDGGSDPTDTDNDNVECAGWIPLAQFDPWVWTRCRDATFHQNAYLRVDNHAALLRYRQYH